MRSDATGPTPAVASPHPGHLVIHEVAPGGAVTMDPAVAYDSVSSEPITNAYETLVAYNGSSTTSFVPVLSTCVPGDLACGIDYNLSDVAGTELIATASSGPLAGEPVYFTFPIDPAARFYDPTTGQSWPVTPTDVEYSVVRALNYANLPFVAAQNGWLLAQALLPRGNLSYDVNGTAAQGVHAPYNNTPFRVLSSMLVNDSAYCPATALAQAGCVTFVADGLGQDWPFLLDLLADPLGGSVVPCGVFSVHGAQVPGFSPIVGLTNGDGPCLLPGNATNTSSASFRSFLAGVPDTYWDPVQLGALNGPNIVAYPRGNVAGSGPYAAVVNLSSGYTLTANPAYVQPSGCSGATAYRYTGYCDPAPGAYVAQVTVLYDPNDSNSIAGFRAGTIDSGVIFPSQVHTDVVCPICRGEVEYLIAPTLSNYFFSFNLLWNRTLFTTDFPGQATPTVPEDFFTGLAAREFLVESYPYLNVENQLLSVDGLRYGFDTVCGPIPFGMGDYYPTNLTCPGGNPDTNPADVGGAAWWWAVGRNASSPYYDPQLAACNSTAPCTFPIAGTAGALTVSSAAQQWITEIYALSGHAVQPWEFTPNPGGKITTSDRPFPIWTLGWAADYPDPTDFVLPYVLPHGLFTQASAVASQLNSTNTSVNRTSCGHAGGAPSDLLYWAYQVAQYTSACEGIAYDAALEAADQAAPLLHSAERVLLYNEMEQILTRLGLYTWFEQGNSVMFLAPWIDLSSVNTNPMVGAGGDQPFFHWAYTPPNTVEISEEHLPVGASWAVRMGTVWNNTTVPRGLSASSGSISLPVANGPFSFQILPPSGYGVVRIFGPGNPNQTGGFVTGGVSVTYRVVFGALEPVSFYQNLTRGHGLRHLFPGAPWQVYLNTSFPHGGDPTTWVLNGTGTVLGPVDLPQGGRYTFHVVGYPPSYRAGPAHGGFTVPAHGLSKLVLFSLLAAPVRFVESGLSAPFSWNITLVNASGAGTAWFAADCGGFGCVFGRTNGSAIVARLPAGVYGWVAATDVAGKTPSPASGLVTVVYPASAAIRVTVLWSG